MSYEENISNYLSILSEDMDKKNAVISNIASTIAASFIDGGKLYMFGGGLSHTIAKYAVEIFNTKCTMDRPPLPAILLSSDVQYLSNSDNHTEIFEKQINTLVSSNDVVFGIFSDPENEIMLQALRASILIGSKTIALTGIESGKISGVADIYFNTSTKSGTINREVQMFVIHRICELIDKIMFSPAANI